MDQNQKLAGIIIGILSSIKETEDFCGEVQMIHQLTKLAIESPNLNQFEKNIINEFAMSAKIVYSFVKALSLNAESKAILGRKLLKLWIKYRLFDVMGIFRKAEEAKRNRISDFLTTFDFDKQNVKDFIVGCFNAAGEELLEEDIPDYQKMFTEGRDPEDLETIFCPPPAPLVEVAQAAYNPDKSIKESFIDMVADFKYFPQGSIEHFLQRELLLSFLQKNEKELSKTEEHLVPELKSAKCDIRALEAIFKDKFGVISGDNAKLFKKIEADEEQKELYENLCALKSKIMTINVLQLQRLINKTNSAKASIKNKQVIFILGTTGSGKSTNILRFLGYSLQLATFKKLQTLIPVERLQQEHTTFYTSPEAKSCTRYINAVPVPDQMYKKGTKSNKKNLVICDSPGFGDNAGVEVDIANGVGMINALYGATSVRVVVLLAYEALISSRMRGAIEIGQIISNLFHDFSQVLESIVFLFNKVPKDQIKEIPKLIRNKLENLTEIEKSNEKLQIFLRELQQQSKQESLFIYPLQSNYKQLFTSISSKPSITDIKENFRYDFTASTKKEIVNYVQIQKGKAKDFFNNSNFAEAQFHLELLKKINDILSNDKIQEAYAEVCKYIGERSHYHSKQFENIFVEIENGEENSKLKTELKQAKETIAEINKYFGHFVGLKVVSESQIKKIADEFKEKLRAKANDPANLNIRYKRAIEIFSDEIDPELKSKVLESLGSTLSKELRELRFSFEEFKFSQMDEGVKKCKQIIEFASSIKSNHRSLQQYSELISSISDRSIRLLANLKEISSEESKFTLTKRLVSESKEKLMHLQAINGLDVVKVEPSLKEEIGNLIKAIGAKCRKYIRELENINFQINLEEGSDRKSNDEKILAAKKNEIELLMDISPIIRESLERDLNYAKENISRKLKENVEILNECINGLKADKKEEIERNIIKIKRATDIVIRCSKLVDNPQSAEIANSITKEFLIYLSKEKQKIRRIDIKLSQIENSTLSQIEQQYKNIETYQKMAEIHEDIRIFVIELKAEFNKTLIYPFVYFNQKELPYLQTKDHYRSIPYFLEKLQKLCFYGKEIEDLLNKEEYSIIAVEEAKLLSKLKPQIEKMKEECDSFLDLEDFQTEPLNLKDLLKTMLSISQKQYTCKYISKHFSFEIAEAINLIRGHFGEIEDKISNAFKNIAGDSDRVQLLLSLLKTCKFYSSIEQIFKNRGEYEKIDFKELQKIITQSYNQSIKNDEDRVRFLIESSKPTTLPWDEVKTIYIQFIVLKNQEGNRKQESIIKEMFKLESKYMNELRKFNNDINDNHEIILNNRDKMNDFLDTFKEALELQTRLNALYEEADKKKINITKKFLREVGSNIIQVFTSQFESIQKMLQDYNIHSIKKKISSFGNLQSIIENVFINEVNEQNEETKELSTKISNFIKEKRQSMLDQICDFQKSHPQIASKEIKLQTDRNLKNLFLIYHNLIEEEVKQKYLVVNQNLKIDAGFKKYYQNIANSEVKQKILFNVGVYFRSLLQSYKQKANQSASQSEVIEKRINQSINNLPSDMKSTQIQALKQLNASIKNENDSFVSELSGNVGKNAQSLDHYFEEAEKAMSKGKCTLHKKLVDKLDEVLVNKSRFLTSAPISQKTKFINTYLIEVEEKNKNYLRGDAQMSKKLKSRLRGQLQRIYSSLEQKTKDLKKIVESFNKADHSSVKADQLISEIFGSFEFGCRLSEDYSELKTNMVGCVSASLQQIADTFTKKAQQKPIDNLLSKDILDEAISRKLHNYIEYINCIGVVIDKIRNELLNSPNSSVIPKATAKYSKIDGYKTYISFYNTQIVGMLQQVDQYELCDNKTRNMNNKQLEAFFISVDTILEVLKAKEEMFNKYILQQKNRYSASKIYVRFGDMFNNLVNDSKVEIEDTFNDYNNSPAYKINLIIDMLKIMKDKKLKLISKDIVNKELTEFERLLKAKFESTKIQSAKKLDAVKQTFVKVQNQMKVQQRKKDRDIKEVKEMTKEKIEAKSKQITAQIDKKIQNETELIKKEQLQNSKKTNISSFTNEYKAELNALISKIEAKFKSEIERLQKEVEKPLKEFTDYVVLFKKAVLDVKHENQKHAQSLDLILSEIPKIGPKFIKLVEKSLSQNENDQQSIGKVLLTTNKIFANYVTNMINRLVQGKDIEYVLENLKKIKIGGREQLTPPFKKNVKECYALFIKKYEEYKKLYKDSPSESTIIQIAIECRDAGIQLRNDFYQSKNPTKGNKVELLAGIFAVWAILKSEKFEEEVEWTMQPHPTQITALMLLLGIVYDKEHLDNRLAQVGTGEGKSVVLAGLSSYLALVGFKVRCACYSSYLSGRDQASFMPLFERLGVQKEIKYGTFNELCEDILNSDGINFKEEVAKMILEKPKGLFDKAADFFGVNRVKLRRGQNEISANPTILVIDEVDVFFEDNFFGNSYCPAIKLRDPTVSNFLQFVFSEVSKYGYKIEIKTLLKSADYRNLVDRYPSLEKLLENQVHGMVAGALAYKHDYFIIDKKIVYKDNDTISPNISYGYKTVFANIYEHSRNNVSFDNLDQALQITLMIAEFSYAKLPNYFQTILGVTGTLEVLPQYKKRQLEERYRIFDQYAIPSAFGLNNRRVDSYAIVPDADLHKTIVQKIKQVKDNRPIIIFFSNSRELYEFFLSPLYESFQNRTSNLTEEHQASVRDSRIVRAVNQNVITLMTNSFGRGTDFILLDQKIKDKGGLHVIQCFLSLDESEEVQIKGRTARQSNSGSYDCVISENWLEQVNLKKENVPNPATADVIHSILLKAREARIDSLAQTTLKMLADADQKHDMVSDLYTKEKIAQKELIKYVSDTNRYPQMTKVVIKTVLGIDGTGSMGAGLKKTCEICSASFERAYKVLEENKVEASIEIKIMIYRNYNSPHEQIIESTAYESTAPNLKRFLERVGPKGGAGNEAMQVLFQAINREQLVDQVILIGDAAPNTSNEVISKRGQKGEPYWNSNGFPATNMNEQLNKFKAKKAPAHSFYLNAAAAFKGISDQTGGIAAPFNINSTRVSDELTSFIVEQILALIDKKDGKVGVNLVLSYRKMFP